MAGALIAINGELAAQEQPRLTLSLRYAEAVRRAGGTPIVLAPGAGGEELGQVLERCDGLLLSGGDDFDTERLGLGPLHPEACPVPAAKQDFDFALVRRALELGLPTLGVCYGMQLLGLAGGGRLYQHLPADLPGGREHRGGVQHLARVAEGTRLRAILGVAELSVISRHHQALSDVGPGWLVSARDEDGTIEAVERPDHPFALGVQWHPELAAEGGVEDRLFAALVSAAELRPGPASRRRGVGAA